MRFFYLLLIIVVSYNVEAQTYPSQNISLIGLIAPNTSTGTAIGSDSRKYSGCWGWFQANKSKEYAISGTSNGVYFIDVTSAATPSVSDFVQGKLGCTWREMKTYQNYCYIISDDASPNSFQIVDMQYLPDSVHVIHDGKQYFERAHAMWIDGDRLYCSGVTYSTGTTASMNIYSLATPSAPLLLKQLNQDIPAISYVHDMYARNDTVFASAGWQGLYVLKFNPGVNTFSQLGSYTGYTTSAYNHSSFLTQNAKYLVFCDEVPTALPIRVVDVQNYSNIQPIQTFKPFAGTTPHNPYLIGNDIAVVSCYEDGLNIYNIATPTNVCLAGYFDTYPQSGGHQSGYVSAYRGNWGAYPYLPSGHIIANDMQNGVFILDASAALTNTNCIPLGVNSHKQSNPSNLMFYPNPATNRIAVSYSSNSISLIQIKTLFGELVFEKKYTEAINDYISIDNLANGTYIISVTENNYTKNKKLIVSH
ncbi:MAG: choice-of-anchor B family protein [Bacteroidota bacterium]|nr:choice-of-anchor B family protein [Bacteroidota bacterium]